MPVDDLITLDQAAFEPRLLGGRIVLWPEQRELIRTLSGPESMNLVVWGRQSGKSTLTAMAAVANATTRPDLDAVLPSGATRYILVAAPGEQQATEFVKVCAAMLEASPLLGPLATSIRSDRIDFTLADGRRTAIRALPANSRAVRGMPASLLVLDEFAHFEQAGGPSSDARMLEALQPSLRMFGSKSKTIVISTPYGEIGKFFELVQAAENGSMPSCTVSRAASWEVDTSLGEQWVEQKRAEMGDDYVRQEFGGEFVTGAGQFMDLRGISFDHPRARPEDASHWIIGLDPAFAQDRFGLFAVGPSVHEDGVLVVGDVDALEPGGRLRSWDARRGREDRLLSRVWKIVEKYVDVGVEIHSDIHQGDAIQSYFERQGVATTIHAVSGPEQTQMFVSLRARLLDGSLRLWKCQRLIEDLRRVRAGANIEQVTLPHYQGGHCDAAAAAALGVWQLRWVDGFVDNEAIAGTSTVAGAMRDALDPLPHLGGGITSTVTGGFSSMQF
jgi:Terminase large subunit, T4likevirus-type, N-terminal